MFPGDATEWNDTDGDGVGDNTDAFPDDPAASLDADGNGNPDQWNPGYTEADSTTGLTLDPSAGGGDGDDIQDEPDGGTASWLPWLIILAITAVLVVLIFVRKKRKAD